MKVKKVELFVYDKFYYADGEASIGEFHPCIRVELYDTGQNFRSLYYGLTSCEKHGVTLNNEKVEFETSGVFTTKIQGRSELVSVRNELLDMGERYKADNLHIGSKLEYYSDKHKVYFNDNVSVYNKGDIEPVRKEYKKEDGDEKYFLKALKTLEKCLVNEVFDYYKGEAFTENRVENKDSLETKFYNSKLSFNYEIAYSIYNKVCELENKSPISRVEYIDRHYDSVDKQELLSYLKNDKYDVDVIEKKNEYLDVKFKEKEVNSLMLDLLKGSDYANEKWDDILKTKEERLDEISAKIKELEARLDCNAMLEIDDYDENDYENDIDKKDKIE